MRTTYSSGGSASAAASPSSAQDSVIEIRHAVIDYELKQRHIRAISDVSMNVKRGKITALVGESGSGKTTLASSILNCISEPGRLTGGEVLFNGRNEPESISVHSLTDKALNAFRWSKVSMVFQGAQSALNPVMTIGEQFTETMKVHKWNVKEMSYVRRSEEVLKLVNLSAERILRMYPHELSGGMKQRVMIAFSLLLRPELIILDEPTTALDVITQHYIFTILKQINEQMGISMLLLTHDIAIVAKFADYVGVMYAGQLMEFGETERVFEHKSHPYTRGLIQATPSLYSDMATMKPIEGSPPDLRKPPSGCRFHPRCPSAVAACSHTEPAAAERFDRHTVKCLLFAEEPAAAEPEHSYSRTAAERNRGNEGADGND